MAEALKVGAFRPAHRVSAARRHVRAELVVRETLVRTRTRLVNVAKALVRQHGLRLPSGMVEHVARRISKLAPAPTLAGELAPLTALLEPLNTQIAAADARITQMANADTTITLLTSMPQIGPVTASAIVAVANDITRLPTAHHFEAYLGPILFS